MTINKRSGKMAITGWLKTSVVMAFALVGSANAEDTEIYKPSQITTPHVMLLLDTSGSMSFQIAGEGTGQRMAAMKNALHQLLDPESTDDDYHIGLARYTSPGGAILYPVSRLGDTADVETAYFGASPADDFVAQPGFVTDDQVLTLSTEASNTVGLRIANVRLPRGAQIESASLVLTVDADYTGPVQLRARSAQQADVTPIADQTAYSALQWRDDYANTTEIATAELRAHTAIAFDVSTQVAAQVGLADWAAGNAMLFEVSAVTGSVGVYAAEGAAVVPGADGSVLDQYRPRLFVKYRVVAGNAYGTPATTVRDALNAVIDLMPTIGDTPLIGAYYETAQYMLGGDAHYGLTRGSNEWRALMRVSNPDSLLPDATLTRRETCNVDALDSRSCVADQLSGARYDSPLVNDCSVSPAIVMLTDGYPNSEHCPRGSGNRCDLEYISSQIAQMPAEGAPALTCDTTDRWDCGIKLSMVLSNPRHYGITNRLPIPTYTIGFGEDVTGNTAEANLMTLARAGVGQGEATPEGAAVGGYYAARNGRELADAFASIFNAVASGINIQAATGVSVDQSNRAQHSDQLYFSLFEPSHDVLWPGNLKRYRLRAPTNDDANFRIVDADDRVAIDGNGYFLPTSRSFWSTEDDGDSVSKGGARARMEANRTVFSFLDAYPAHFPSLGEPLLRLDAALYGDEGTATTLNTVLETATNEEGAGVLNWLNQVGDTEPVMGAPLHSKPLLVNFGFRDETRTTPINTLFLSTNQGLLHAFDSDTGNELFAVAPRELLKNQKRFLASEPGPQLYGLDASWIAYRYDENHNGDVRDAHDFVYLYGGMRMGGRNYYAFDVTTAYQGASPSPRLKFALTPETAVGDDHPYATLGQTWSVPLLMRLADACAIAQPVEQCTSRVVMMFGGGYDYASQEKTGELMPTPARDTYGASLYMVDAVSGDLLTWAGGHGSGADSILSGMNYSITSTIRAFDSDFDGFADHLYAVDLGGQVLRFDLEKNAHGQSMARIRAATIVASLGGAQSALHADYRRFYDAPALTLMRDPDGTRWVAIAVGSGYRSHPVNAETREAFFVIRDRQPFNSSVVQPVITFNDLADASTRTLSDDDLRGRSGWYMMLHQAGPGDAGEKVVGEPFVLNENLVFATYVPAPPAIDVCKVNTGHMNMYQVKLRNAAPALPDANNDGSLDRLLENVAPGLVSGVALLQTLSADGQRNEIASMSTSLIDIDGGTSRNLVRTRWRSNEGEIRMDEAPNAN